MISVDALLCLHSGQYISEIGRLGHKLTLHCVNCYVKRVEGQVACTAAKFMEGYFLLLDSSTLVVKFPALFGKHLDVPAKVHIILPTPLIRS